MSREDTELRVRAPDSLKERLKEAAHQNRRSMNAEIIARLETSFAPARVVSISEWPKAVKTPPRPMPSELPHNANAPTIQGSVLLISWMQAGEYADLVDNSQSLVDTSSIGYAGEWILTAEEVRRHTYALRVYGDTMETDFFAGDIVIVEPDEDPRPGDFVVIQFNKGEECTLKQLVRDGGNFYLKPSNPRYPITPFPANGVIVGVVISKTTQYRRQTAT